MKIGLYNLEPKIHNSALMQVSRYHKNKGDEVELYRPFVYYDKVYAFSLFNFTDKSTVTDKMICGGTGFDIKKRLPVEIESCDLDYSIDPECDYSIIWFSRGCIRACPFCIVRDKEGYICPVKPKNLNPIGSYIEVMDNNFFANPEWKDAIRQLVIWNQPVKFQGIDIRLLDEEQCGALNIIRNTLKIGHKRRLLQFNLAWDNPKEDLLPQFRRVIQWIKPYKIMVYVLIGFNSTLEEDLYRVQEIDKLGMDPFVMPYNKKDDYQKRFARFVNNRAIFKTTTWSEYNEKYRTIRRLHNQ